MESSPSASPSPPHLPRTYLERTVKRWSRLEDCARLEEVYVLLQAQERPKPRLPEGEKDMREDLPRGDEERLKIAGILQKKSLEAKPAPPPPLPPPPVPLAEALKASSFLVLVGEPGAGKTVTLQYLGLTFAHAPLEGAAPLGLHETRIPVRLDLKVLGDFIREMNGETPPMERVLLQEIRALDDSLTMETLKAWRDQGKLLVLLDALDEVDDRMRDKVRGEIVNFRLRTKGCRVVVATRPAGYYPLPEPFQDYQIRPLDKDQALLFIQRWLRDLVGLDEATANEQGTALWKVIDKKSALRRLALTPLTLKMMVEVEIEEPGALQRVKSRGGLYERYVEKIAWERAKKRGTREEDKEWALIMLETWAWHRHMRGRQSENELRQALEATRWTQPGEKEARPLVTSDAEWERAESLLRHQLGLLALVGDNIAFTHQTWQEYFIARHLAKAWEKDGDVTWRFLRPRLHLPAWRKSLFLFVVMLTPSQAENFIKKIRKARSAYEPQLHRDLRLAISLAGEMGWSDFWFPYLTHKNGQIRQSVVEALGALGPEAPGVVAELLQALHDSDWRARGTAAWALGAMGPEAVGQEGVVAGLLQTLHDSDWRVRWAVAEVLGAWGPDAATQEDVVTGLFQVLHDSDSDVRGDAAAVLRAWGQEAARQEDVVTGLLQALHDPAMWVSWTAAEALGVMGPEAARQEGVVDGLLQALRDFGVRGAAAWALGAMGPEAPGVVDGLLQALYDSNSWVREAAAKALETMGPEAARHYGVVDGLLQALRDSNLFVSGAAVEALGAMGPEAPGVVVGLLHALRDSNLWAREAAARALGAMGPEATKHDGVVAGLLQALHDSTLVVRGAAAEALGAVGPEAPGVVDGLLQALCDSNRWARGAAARALETMGPEAARHDGVVDGLLYTLHDSNRWARGAAARALGAMGPKAARQGGVVAGLLQALYDSDLDVHRAAAGALGAMGPEVPGVVIGLLQALHDSDWLVRWAAAWALGAMGPEAAGHEGVAAGLFQALLDSNSNMRKAAAEALGALGPEAVRQEGVVAGLLQALHDSDLDVRRAAARALGAMGLEAARQEGVLAGLLQAIHDSDSYVREAAAKALKAITDEKIIQQQFPRLRRQVWFIWPLHRKETYEVIEAWLPVWEAVHAREEAEKTGLWDPLNPPPPPQWRKWLRAIPIVLAAFFAFLAATALLLLIEPIKDALSHLLEPTLQTLSPGMLYVALFVFTVFAAGFGALARYLWSQR